MSPPTLKQQKIDELKQSHGVIFTNAFSDNKFPEKQIDNFYGRHVDRQEAILNFIEKGHSYSAAYQASKDTFDTKRWGKIPNRTASCRGLVLKTVCELLQTKAHLNWDQEEIHQLLKCSQDIENQATLLIQQLSNIEMQESTPSTAKSKAECTLKPTTFTKANTKLTTALSKLRKNVRDVPQMTLKLGALPTVKEVAQTVMDAGRIRNGFRLLQTISESDFTQSVTRSKKNNDPWCVGTEYAPKFTSMQPNTRERIIATHKRPDADALVSSWLVERFLTFLVVIHGSTF